jgi:hypothetical protein
MYLRKSRQDDPNETVEQVLAKHEAILQEWAKRELGYAIPEDCIYREVVSGESLDERVEIQKVMTRMEDPTVVGIIVVEPQRLSRGDLEDCGKLINDLRFTRTLVATPMMTYNMDNKMERRFFQDELMRGRDFLEYTKEILLRGRIAAVKRGCYIHRATPYGYDKVVIGKDHTLTPNKDADVVRLIFDLYVNEHMSYQAIADKLNQMGIPSQKGASWTKSSVRNVVANLHYDGKVFFYKTKSTTTIENGKRRMRCVEQPMEERIIAPGKHPALVDHETFVRAQERLDNNPPKKAVYGLKNPYCGILRCAKCGKVMQLQPYDRSENRLMCTSRPNCFKTAKFSTVHEAIVTALEQSELPALEKKLAGGEGKSVAIQKKILDRLESQMVEYKRQEETQYDLLETGKYTQELFDRRNAALRQKMDACQKQIYETRSTMPEEVNYEEKIIALKDAIRALKDPKMEPIDKNRLLKAIVERIDYSVVGDQTIRNFVDLRLAIFLRL